MDQLRSRALWIFLIGAAANLSLPGASKHVAPLLQRYYDGEDVGAELWKALEVYSKLLPDQIQTIFAALKEAREDAQ